MKTDILGCECSKSDEFPMERLVNDIHTLLGEFAKAENLCTNMMIRALSAEIGALLCLSISGEENTAKALVEALAMVEAGFNSTGQVYNRKITLSQIEIATEQGVVN